MIKRGYKVFCVGRNLEDKRFLKQTGVNLLDLDLTSRNLKLDELQKKIPNAYAVINTDPDTIDWFAGYVIWTTGGVSSKIRRAIE